MKKYNSIFQESPVSIYVYSLFGKLVKKFFSNRQHDVGAHKITWDIDNQPDGVYLCRMIIGNQHLVQKIMVFENP